MALRLAGVGAHTPDPADGRIEREPDGSPQGTLHEGAVDLVARLQPPPTDDELCDALLRAQAHLHALGITGWQDAIVLLGLYVLYLRRSTGGDPEPPHLVGVAAELAKLPKRPRTRATAGLMAFAAVAILITAEPFANAVIATGTSVGVGQYLVVQWLVPMATEMPELVVAFVLVTHRRPGQGAAVLLSSAVSQWTLALGTLPIAYRVGAGEGPLPLLGRERVELILTMALGLYTVATLVTLNLGRADAVLMLALFGVQAMVSPVLLRAAMAIMYLVLAIDLLSAERWALRALIAAVRGSPPRGSPDDDPGPARSPDPASGRSPRARSGRRSPAEAG